MERCESMKNVSKSKYEIMEKSVSRSDEKVMHLLESVKDFVNQNFNSKGVVANLINKHGKETYVNVSNYFLVEIFIFVSSDEVFQMAMYLFTYDCIF